MTVLDRFLRYVTPRHPRRRASTTCPSTPASSSCCDHCGELRGLGLADVTLDENGYLMATIPATVGDRDVPIIGLHRPRRHVAGDARRRRQADRPPAWDGGDIVLPDDPTVVLRASDHPELAAQIGHDIVTASGMTLLGADDKAGVAAIVSAAAELMAHRRFRTARSASCFTPDEEIGRGPNHFDVARFGAACAYTLDGGGCGELEFESFSADVMRVTFIGFNTHPGYAKGRW